MKSIKLFCLALIVVFALCGCTKQVDNNDTSPKVTDTQKEQIKYLGKYAMRNLPPRSEEMKKFLKEMGEEPDTEGEKLLQDGLSCEDLGIKSEVLCIEIKDNNDVNVCIGGFAAQEAKLVTEDGKKYIELESPCFNGFTDKILLGEKEVCGKNYLTFENEAGKRAYFIQLKNDKINSYIKINGYRDFEASGIFQIDPEVTRKLTGKDPYTTWGSGFRTYGSSMKINEEGTGNYSIGVSEYKRFKLDKSLKSGLTTVIIVDEQGLVVEHEGANYALNAEEIDGKNYLVLNEGLIVSCWKCIGENQIVFEYPDGTIRIWG